MSQVGKFEEYKFLIEDTARLTECQQTVTNIYVAVNTILLSAVNLLVKDAGLQSRVVAAATTVLLAAGIAICVFWYLLIVRLKRRVVLRLGELRKMEELPEMWGYHRVINMEVALYPSDAQGNMLKGGIYFTNFELTLRNVFIALYAVFLIDIVLATWAGAI